MKIIIDPYRGGKDIGKIINNKYEKDILLELSKNMANLFKEKNIEVFLVRNDDSSITDDERNKIINNIKENEDLIIQNRLSENNELNIIYPLKKTDKLPSLISKELENNNINVDNYYQRRLPENTKEDYYSIIRNNKENEVLIIEYNNPDNYLEIVPYIVNAISKYIGNKSTYIVKKGDTLYNISKKYNISVEELKKINNLSSNLLNIGTTLTIPESIKENNNNITTYTIKKGDTLYSISKKYNISVDELKKTNNITSNILTIGSSLKIPTTNSYIEYQIKKGDTLYNIAKAYNITVNEIKLLNNLNSNILTIGSSLKIPR